MGQRWNHKGNYKLLWDEWQQKQECQNWNTAKAMFKGEFMTVNSYI